MKGKKATAGWIAFLFAIILSIIAAVGRWFPSVTASGSEAVIISSFLGFAATAFGVSAYEKSSRRKDRKIVQRCAAEVRSKK